MRASSARSLSIVPASRIPFSKHLMSFLRARARGERAHLLSATLDHTVAQDTFVRLRWGRSPNLNHTSASVLFPSTSSSWPVSRPKRAAIAIDTTLLASYRRLPGRSRRHAELRVMEKGARNDECAKVRCGPEAETSEGFMND